MKIYTDRKIYTDTLGLNAVFFSVSSSSQITKVLNSIKSIKRIVKEIVFMRMTMVAYLVVSTNIHSSFFACSERAPCFTAIARRTPLNNPFLSLAFVTIPR